MNNLKIPQSQVHSCSYFQAKTAEGRGQVARLTCFPPLSASTFSASVSESHTVRCLSLPLLSLPGFVLTSESYRVLHSSFWWGSELYGRVTQLRKKRCVKKCGRLSKAIEKTLRKSG